VDFQMPDKPLEKVVVNLSSEEYKSTWPGNKSIYPYVNGDSRRQ